MGAYRVGSIPGGNFLSQSGSAPTSLCAPQSRLSGHSRPVRAYLGAAPEGTTQLHLS